MRIPLSAFVTLTVVAASSLVGLAASPAHAACTRPPQPGQPQIPDTPWHLQVWNNLDELPPGVSGKGVKVAVLDSGVDPNHFQLKDKVIDSIDKLHFVPTAEDCFGHGTGVAGIIAGKGGQKYRGIAPGAQILSARVSESTPGNENPENARPDEMAAAIDWVVGQGANVINMSFAYTSGEAGLEAVKAAVQRAIDRNVVVVAAAGNNNLNKNPTPYPAAWPGVVGVGAIAIEGYQKLPESQVGPWVDISAPGVQIWVPRPGGGYATADGTSFAAPMVAATAALIFDRFRDQGITGKQVVERLLATADPAPGGRGSKGYGAGIVNPVRAVNDLVDDVAPRPGKPLAGEETSAAALRAAERAAQRKQQALWVGGIVLIGVVLAVVLMTALPAGGRRRWRPAGR